MKRWFVILFLVACTDENNSRRTLEAEGYTDIVITGYSPLMCGDDDMFSTGFTANNPHGKRVSGTVCCGALTKGCTVRF